VSAESRSPAEQAELARLFEEQAMPHTDALYRTALRMTRNSADAEDLVQEAMLKAFRFFHRYEQGTNIRAWLFKIMTNLFINRYRKKTRSPAELSIDDMEEFVLFRQMTSTGTYDPDRPDDQVFGELFADKVKEEIENLPDEFRTVALLSILEGFSYQEIAEIAGLQLGTVKSRLFRGRKILQSRLAEYARQSGYTSSSPES
jgi:RNA polymerase sigma-70 factor (ECF subfamily)